MNVDLPPAASFGKKLGELIKRKRQTMGLTQLQLAEDAYGSGKRTRRISELENGTVDNPQAKTIDPVIVHLRITQEELQECAAGTGWSPDVDLERAYREAKNLIEAAAAQFEHARPDASLADLEDYLRSKAIEWRQLRDRFDELDMADNAIGSLLNQARSALSSGNLAEVDTLLLQAEDTHQENKTIHEVSKQAEIRMLRADAFLFSENPDRAFDLYYSASYFFDPFKPEVTVEMLAMTAGRVYESSLRSLTPRFEISRRLLDALAEHSIVKNDPDQLGIANYRRGLIYMNEAVNINSSSISLDKLQQSMQYARLAVQAFPVGSSAQYGVYSRISLANIFQNINKFDRNKAHLEEAIDVLRIALVMAEDDVKDQLANVRNALGGIYLALRHHADDIESRRFLDDALVEFTAAMNEAEIANDIAVWGGARMNRARVLSQMAKLETDENSRRHFLHIRAIAEISAALETYPVTKFPDRFAEAHFELAHELSHCSDNVPDDFRTTYLIRGLNHLEAAKIFFSKSMRPRNWASIHILAGNMFVKLGEACEESKKMAQEYAMEAKTCFDEAAVTFDIIGNSSEAARCRNASERLTSLQT